MRARPLKPTWVMVDPVGEDGFCRRLAVRLRGWHAGKTIYTDGRGDAGHSGGADARGSAPTCNHEADIQRQGETVRTQLDFFATRTYKKKEKKRKKK